MLGGLIQDVIHQGMGFSHGQAADGKSCEIHIRDGLGAVFPQIRVHAPLDDAEEPLILSGLGFQAPPGPAGSPFRRLFGIGVVRWVRDAFIESHDDVRS